MKPMLAATLEQNQMHNLRFPIYASPKLDGVRALIIDGKVMSRSMKDIPNKHVQALFGQPEFEGLDGELIVGAPNAKDVYRVTQGAVARLDGKPQVTFYVFDIYASKDIFGVRIDRLKRSAMANGQIDSSVVVLEQRLVANVEQLLAYEQEVLAQGYEGLILRSPLTYYKNGRSTLNEQGMLKLKRFTDGEAVIIGMEEEMSNQNAAQRNALGRTERSTAQAGMVGKQRMGALIVRDCKSGIEFNIGTGFTMKDRETFWANTHKVIGMVVKYKSFLIGVKEAPRFPVYLGIRNDWDMS